MTHTNVVVSFGLYALEVKQDAEFLETNLNHQPFVKIIDLKTNNVSGLPYASYEPDFWLLDGNYKFLPTDTSDVHVGWMSESMSDGNGDFADPLVLNIWFWNIHSSDGLTLRFSQFTGDYANKIGVQYFDDGPTTLIRTDIYYPTSWEFSTGQAVEGFRVIRITFWSTSRPYRYLRVEGIDFGTLIYFSGDQIKAASVVEEIDPMSGEARFNTFDVRLYSEDEAFSLINPSGYYQYLQERQPISVHETVGNRTIFIGSFYLDEWKNRSETEIEFSCIDLLGALDKVVFMGGMYDQDADWVINSILSPINAPYTLDTNLSEVNVSGWIPICSCREALQQVALAIGAYLDCSRSATIKIYQAPDIATATPTATITRAQKGKEQTLALKPFVTGVEVTAHNYVSSTTSKQVYNGVLTAAGSHTITFSEPLHDLSVTGATITESEANYAILSVTVEGTVTLSGQVYVDTRSVYAVNTPGLSANTKPNILKITDATLVNSSNVAEVCQRVYDYNQNRLSQTLKLFAPTDIELGDVVYVQTLYNQTVRAMIERMSIDLFGGMVAKVELTGVVP